MRVAGRVVAGAAALAAVWLAYLYLTIPDVRPLVATNPETTAFMELRAREAAAAGKKARRVHRFVRYDQISASLKRAVLVAEDDAFWQHEGIDLEQIRESIEANLEQGGIARGGSTITQQLAKNLYLSPSRSPVRKLRELLITRRLEAELSKRRILEIYLNVIEWGDGIWGAEAAARAYFKKGAAAIGPEEAALMAGAIRSPLRLNPGRPSARLVRLQQRILQRMGAVTPPSDGPVPDAPPSDAPAPDAVGPPGGLPPGVIKPPDSGKPPATIVKPPDEMG